MSRRAIFCVDPGGTTGVAWGIFDTRAESVIHAMQTRTDDGSTSIHLGRIEGVTPRALQKIIRDQVASILSIWDRFVSEAMYQFDRHGDVDIEFVAEHFVLTGGSHHKPGVEGIFPAYMLGALIEGTNSEEIILQTASTGMRFDNREFHTKYGTWVVGKPHEREAWAHVAARMHKILK
jgi:hypothetical protein